MLVHVAVHLPSAVSGLIAPSFERLWRPLFRAPEGGFVSVEEGRYGTVPNYS